MGEAEESEEGGRDEGSSSWKLDRQQRHAWAMLARKRLLPPPAHLAEQGRLFRGQLHWLRADLLQAPQMRLRPRATGTGMRTCGERQQERHEQP